MYLLPSKTELSVTLEIFCFRNVSVLSEISIWHYFSRTHEFVTFKTVFRCRKFSFFIGFTVFLQPGLVALVTIFVTVNVTTLLVTHKVLRIIDYSYH